MKNNGKLDGIKIAVLAADGFEWAELSIPKKLLEEAGSTVDVISLHEGKIRGMNLSMPAGTISVDRALGEAEPGDFDGLFIAGGFIGTDLMRQSKEARAFVRAFHEAGKPIATLSNGPSILISAEVMRGRRVASWPGIRDDIVNAGGIWRDEAVVRDGNLLSSRGPGDLPSLVPAMIAHFAARGEARLPGEDVMPGDGKSSPRRDEPPELAVGAARRLAGPALPMLAGAAIGAVIGAFARK